MGTRLETDEALDRGNPIDSIHELLDGCTGERTSPYDLCVEFQGEWGLYRFHYIWHEPSSFLSVMVWLDFSIVAEDHPGLCDLLNAINTKLNLGHIEYVKETLQIHVRYGLYLENGLLSPTLFEFLTDSLLYECDRFYPVIDSFVHQNYSHLEAMGQAFLDVRGHA